jgi:DNA-directed RNA polymerase subunit RPC12/RpoP
MKLSNWVCGRCGLLFEWDRTDEWHEKPALGCRNCGSYQLTQLKKKRKRRKQHDSQNQKAHASLRPD